jgi:hypothetical protein
MTHSEDFKQRFFEILRDGPLPAYNPIAELIREHCTDVMIFLAEDYENLKRLTPYELYDLFMQKEAENVDA